MADMHERLDDIVLLESESPVEQLFLTIILPELLHVVRASKNCCMISPKGLIINGQPSSCSRYLEESADHSGATSLAQGLAQPCAAHRVGIVGSALSPGSNSEDASQCG